MRLAVISDIHGNNLALEAVLDDIAGEGVDATINLGDVASGPMAPRETVERLMGLDFPSVRGNHDRVLLETGPIGPIDAFAREQLAPRHLEWLARLPATRVVEDTIFMCHGTPVSDTGWWLDTPWESRRVMLPDEAAVTALAGDLDFPVLVCGHSHLARSVRLRDERLIVNPGSVGVQIVHGSPDARYGLIERKRGAWHVALKSVPYDHASAARQAAANGFPHWDEVLRTGWAGPEGLF